VQSTLIIQCKPAGLVLHRTTSNLQARIRADRSKLKNNKHPHSGLQAAYNRFGPESVTWDAPAFCVHLRYSQPLYATIEQLAAHFHIPTEHLKPEIERLGLPQALFPSADFDPLNPVCYNGQSFPDIYHLARHLNTPAEHLYWAVDRGLTDLPK